MSARSETEESILDEALAWQQALDRDDADWDGYLAWLEADPRHRLAFDEVSLLDRAIDERAAGLKRLTIAPPTAQPAVRTRRRWIMGSLAATVALAIGIPALWIKPADTVYATRNGESRQIALEDGTSVNLAPATKLIAIQGDPRHLELTRGEAYFSVRHDPARTLTIKAGDYAVTDIGTRFAMNATPGSLTVSVAEGHVSVGGNQAPASRLAAGQQLVAARGKSAAQIRNVAPGDVGSWRQGRLVYDNTPLEVVAADLTRYSGKTVTVDPTLHDTKFSGVLAIGDGSRLVQNLAAIMSIASKADGDTIRLVAAPAR